MIHRALVIPLSPNARQHELDTIHQIARHNGYSHDTINRIYLRHNNRMAKSALGLHMEGTLKNNTYRALQYTPYNNIINNIFSK